MAELSFNIGIAYNPSINVEPIEYEVETVVKPNNYNALIENSYSIKRAKNNLESVNLNRNDLYREYNEYDYVGNQVSNLSWKKQI